MSSKSLLLAAVLAGLAVPQAWANEKNGPSTYTITADFMDYNSSASVATADGHVVIVSSGVRVEADNVILYLSSDTAFAKGHVHIQDGLTSIYGETADYQWTAATGTVHDAYILDPPWRIWGREIIRVGPEKYVVKHGALTSCDEDPPHYHFRGRSGTYWVKRRANLYSGALALERTPIFWTPFYTHSLAKHAWTYRVTPGRNSRDGIFAKTWFGVPITTNTYGKLYYDYFQHTGKGYGAEYDYFTPQIKGSIYGYRIYDAVAQDIRWVARAGHWQQIRPGLTLQGNLQLQRDPLFNNHFFVENSDLIRDRGESDAALTYQNAYYTSRISVEEDEVFSLQRNTFVRQKTILPSLSFQTQPLRIGASVYANVSANITNQYTRPQTNPLTADPLNLEQDKFQQTANGSLSFSRDFRISKNMTLVPSAGVSENWISWQAQGAGVRDKDITIGRGFTGLNFRQRITRSLDYDLTHTYRVRWRPNTFRRDKGFPGVNDGGLEANNAAVFVSYFPSPLFWARMNSGYDFIDLPEVSVYTVRQKIVPPTLELSMRPNRFTEMFYRQTQALYPVRRPQLTQFSVAAGKPLGPKVSSGWSYNSGTPGRVQITHGAAFALTKGWWLDGNIRYDTNYGNGFQLDHLIIQEKNLVLRRDLHCWLLQVTLRARPGVNEAFFRIDLKTDFENRHKMINGEEEQFHPGSQDVNEGTTGSTSGDGYVPPSAPLPETTTAK